MSESESKPPAYVSNKPVYTFLTLVVFVTAMVVLYITNHASDGALFIAFVVTTLPSLVASFSAERASRDIRNGVLKARVKEAAHETIQEAGVITRQGPVATAQLAGIAELLDRIDKHTTETHETVTNHDS